MIHLSEKNPENPGDVTMNNLENKLCKLKRVALYFFISFVPLELIGLILQPLLVNLPIKNFKINLGLFSINIIGFLIPLFVTILLILYIIFKQKTRVKEINANSSIAWVGIGLLWTFIILLSLNYRLIVINSGGSGTSIPLFALVLIILLYYIIKENYRQALLLAYILGFLLGASSDFISTFGIAHLSSGIWGGGTFLDGDFYIPLILVIFVLITEKLEPKNSQKEKRRDI